MKQIPFMDGSARATWRVENDVSASVRDGRKIAYSASFDRIPLDAYDAGTVQTTIECHDDLVRFLVALRGELGALYESAGIHLNSLVRTIAHNTSPEVGGAWHSRHTVGTAADVGVNGWRYGSHPSADAIKDAVERASARAKVALVEKLFRTYPWGFHVAVNPGRAPDRLRARAAQAPPATAEIRVIYDDEVESATEKSGQDETPTTRPMAVSALEAHDNPFLAAMGGYIPSQREAARRRGALRIGDVWFTVPPESIDFMEENQTIALETVRSAGSPKLPTGHRISGVQFRLHFTTPDQINTELRPLIAMFRRTPFLTIENGFLQKTIYPEMRYTESSVSIVRRDAIAHDADFNAYNRAEQLAAIAFRGKFSSDDADLKRLAIYLALRRYGDVYLYVGDKQMLARIRETDIGVDLDMLERAFLSLSSEDVTRTMAAASLSVDMPFGVADRQIAISTARLQGALGGRIDLATLYEKIPGGVEGLTFAVSREGISDADEPIPVVFANLAITTQPGSPHHLIATATFNLFNFIPFASKLRFVRTIADAELQMRVLRKTEGADPLQIQTTSDIAQSVPFVAFYASELVERRPPHRTDIDADAVAGFATTRGGTIARYEPEAHTSTAFGVAYSYTKRDLIDMIYDDVAFAVAQNEYVTALVASYKQILTKLGATESITRDADLANQNYFWTRFDVLWTGFRLYALYDGTSEIFQTADVAFGQVRAIVDGIFTDAATATNRTMADLKRIIAPMTASYTSFSSVSKNLADWKEIVESVSGERFSALTRTLKEIHERRGHVADADEEIGVVALRLAGEDDRATVSLDDLRKNGSAENLEDVVIGQTWLMGASAVNQNKLVPVGITQYEIPTFQHFGTGDWRIQLSFRTTDPGFIRQLRQLNIRANRTQRVQAQANVKKRLLIDTSATIACPIVNLLGVKRVVVEAVRYSTVEGAVDMFDVTLELAQADFVLIESESMRQARALNDIQPIRAISGLVDRIFFEENRALAIVYGPRPRSPFTMARPIPDAATKGIARGTPVNLIEDGFAWDRSADYMGDGILALVPPGVDIDWARPTAQYSGYWNVYPVRIQPLRRELLFPPDPNAMPTLEYTNADPIPYRRYRRIPVAVGTAHDPTVLDNMRPGYRSPNADAAVAFWFPPYRAWRWTVGGIGRGIASLEDMIRTPSETMDVVQAGYLTIDVFEKNIARADGEIARAYRTLTGFYGFRYLIEAMETLHASFVEYQMSALAGTAGQMPDSMWEIIFNPFSFRDSVSATIAARFAELGLLELAKDFLINLAHAPEPERNRFFALLQTIVDRMFANDAAKRAAITADMAKAASDLAAIEDMLVEHAAHELDDLYPDLPLPRYHGATLPPDFYLYADGVGNEEVVRQLSGAVSRFQDVKIETAKTIALLDAQAAAAKLKDLGPQIGNAGLYDAAIGAAGTALGADNRSERDVRAALSLNALRDGVSEHTQLTHYQVMRISQIIQGYAGVEMFNTEIAKMNADLRAMGVVIEKLGGLYDEDAADEEGEEGEVERRKSTTKNYAEAVAEVDLPRRPEAMRLIEQRRAILQQRAGMETALGCLRNAGIESAELARFWGVISEETAARSEGMHHLALKSLERSGPARMLRAFPTVKVYFIEEDSFEWRSFDDYFDYNAIYSVDIVKGDTERNEPAATDVCVIRLSNVTDVIANPSDMAGTEKFSYNGTALVFEDTHMTASVPIQNGTKIVVKMGYGESHRELPTVFIGTVAGLVPGDVVELTAQGFGIELTMPIASPQKPLIIGLGSTIKTFGDLAAYILDRIKGLHHFGKKSFLGGRGYRAGFQESTQKALRDWILNDALGIEDVFISTTHPRDENIYLPRRQTEIYAALWGKIGRWFADWVSNPDENIFGNTDLNWVFAGQTAWDALNEIALYQNDYVVAVLPYNDEKNPYAATEPERVTLYLGPRFGYYKYTSDYDDADRQTFHTMVKQAAEMDYTPANPIAAQIGAIRQAIVRHLSTRDAEAEAAGIVDREAKDAIGNLIERLMANVVSGPGQARATLQHVAELDFRTQESDPFDQPGIDVPILKSDIATTRDSFEELRADLASVIDPLLGIPAIGGVTVFIEDDDSFNVIASGGNADAARRARAVISDGWKAVKSSFMTKYQFLRAVALVYGIEWFIRAIGNTEHDRSLVYAYVNWWLGLPRQAGGERLIPEQIRDANAAAWGIAQVAAGVGGRGSASDAFREFVSYDIRSGMPQLVTKLQGYRSVVDFHYASSMTDIIENTVEANSEQIANRIVMEFPDDPHDDGDLNFEPSDVFTYTVSVNDSIRPDAIRERRVFHLNVDPDIGSFLGIHWGQDDANRVIAEAQEHARSDRSQRIAAYNTAYAAENNTATARWSVPSYHTIAANLLRRAMRPMYDGELVIMGNPRIKPNDIVFVDDYRQDMHGPVTVRRVVHHFSRDTGFITKITPGLVTFHRDMLNAATMQEIEFVQSAVFWKTFAQTVWDTALGFVFGSVLSAGFGSALGLTLTGAVGVVQFFGNRHANAWVEMNNLFGRNALMMVPLWFRGEPYVAGLDGYLLKDYRMSYWDRFRLPGDLMWQIAPGQFTETSS